MGWRRLRNESRKGKSKVKGQRSKVKNVSARQMSLPTGAKIGPYEIVALLGAGGMGEVYRGRDSRLGRDVALKILLPNFAADAERMARFQREAHGPASPTHTQIV